MSAAEPVEPRWARPALVVLLAATAAAWFANLDASGWANSFYAAAAQAGSKNFEAALFGSLDASNAISIDKAPGALWPIEMFVRVFGLSAWSVLAPQVLEGVATAWLVGDILGRSFGRPAGLIGVAAVALCPVATLMFRFDNPDAALALAVAFATWATIRLVETPHWRFAVVAGAGIGYGFLAKELQVLLAVPALAVVVAVCVPVSLRRRAGYLAAAGASALVAAGWWVAVVTLTPAADRPWVGGSRHDSFLGVTFGYNGFGRLFGHEPGSAGPSSSAAGGAGPAGPLRLADQAMRAQIGWLLPAACLLALAGLIWLRRCERGDLRRAVLVAAAGELVVTAGAISLGRGIIHPYYAVALAAPIALCVAGGAVLAWRRRSTFYGRGVLALVLGATVGTAVWIGAGEAGFGLSAVGVATTVVLVAGRELGRPQVRRVAVLAAAIACLAGPAAASALTVAAGHATVIPVAGADPQPYLAPPGNRFGSLIAATDPPPGVVEALRAGAGRFTWAAATVGAMRAAGLQLASLLPVMAVGGFNGTDPFPSLGAFRRDVADRRIHFFVVAGRPLWANAGRPPSIFADARAITAWVEARYAPRRIDGFELFDLAAARKSSSTTRSSPRTPRNQSARAAGSTSPPESSLSRAAKAAR